MIQKVSVLENNTKVKIKSPGPGERGTWVITGTVTGTTASGDPAYDIQNEASGRRRIKRRSQLQVRRGT